MQTATVAAAPVTSLRGKPQNLSLCEV